MSEEKTNISNENGKSEKAGDGNASTKRFAVFYCHILSRIGAFVVLFNFLRNVPHFLSSFIN